MNGEIRDPAEDDTARLTPAMRQHREIKARYPDAILFFRIGDFYETFGPDAEIVSRELEIVLTSRSKGPEGKVPLAGVPYHAAEGYIGRLVAKGYKVAVCDQVGDPKNTKGIVAREVVRVVTPGTVSDGALLSSGAPRYLMALAPEEKPEKGYGTAFLDVSTGEFFVTVSPGECSLQDIATGIARYQPSECIIPSSLAGTLRDWLTDRDLVVTPCPDELFSQDRCREILMSHLQVSSLDGFGCGDYPAAVCAAGAALLYAKDTQRSDLAHVRTLGTRIRADSLILDAITMRNLEIIRNIRGGTKENTLFSALDVTETPMGSRLLLEYLAAPSVSVSEIDDRLDSVEFFVRNPAIRRDLRAIVNKCADIDRILGRISLGSAGPRELLALAAALERIPEIRSLAGSGTAEFPRLLKSACDRMPDCRTIPDRIRSAIAEDPPALARNGGVIRDGFNRELDTLKQVADGGRDWVAELQREERETTGIKSLKVGYNRIFGYYIEVTKPNLHLVPERYERKQTTANGERFTLPELREKEALITNADERLLALELEIYANLLTELKSHIPELQEVSQGFAVLDVAAALAEAAEKFRYVRPVLDDGTAILLREGRHPVVERFAPQGFVPNDAHLDSAGEQVLVITGANMAGKSTYMRSVALLCIMAQAGSFVPAGYAKIGIVDRIFTRVGAFDDLASGQSTFMVEMLELANILNNVTTRSLVILDEIGRGTSTADGYAIAKAVLEFLHGKSSSGPRTLFATHFHELSGIESDLKRVRNYHFAVKESKGDVAFLRKIIPGSTDRSYGIHVARCAGIPRRVTERAEHILKEEEDRAVGQPGTRARKYTQLLLLDSGSSPEPTGPDPLVQELASLDPNTLTPLDALVRLTGLREKALNRERTR
ncbi:MAG: DNA mismatch repair protein MutS [Methanoregulaceae archaeon]